MANVVEMKKARLEIASKRAFRNWKSKFREDFDGATRLSHLSDETLTFLAQGKADSSFYLYDLIMNLQDLGSGFELNDLNPEEKISVIDRQLFLLDRIRFEYMKRLGWLESYPGEEYSLSELVISFDKLGPVCQTRHPDLAMDHPDYQTYGNMIDPFEREEFIRKLIVKAIEEIKYHSST